MLGSQCQALKPLWQGMRDDIFQNFIWQAFEYHCDFFGKENASQPKVDWWCVYKVQSVYLFLTSGAMPKAFHGKTVVPARDAGC